MSGKASRYVWASCLSRFIALQNFSIRFPHSGAKIRGIEYFTFHQAKVPVRQCHKYFNAVHLLPKDLRFEHGTPNLLLAPGAI